MNLSSEGKYLNPIAQKMEITFALEAVKKLPTGKEIIKMNIKYSSIEENMEPFNISEKSLEDA